MLGYDAVLKWAILGAMLSALTVLAACAQNGAIGLPSSAGESEAAIEARPPRDGAPPTQASLIGKVPADIEGLLGEPTLLRQELGAQVWQYAGRRCVLLLYLYEEADKSYHVAHMEARPRPGGFGDVNACLAATYATS